MNGSVNQSKNKLLHVDVCLFSFAGILMKFSPALQNLSWRVLRSQSPAPVPLMRRASGWALWVCINRKGCFHLCLYGHWFLLRPLQNTKENPIHIINVSIKTADTEDDDALVTAFTAFAHSKVSWLLNTRPILINVRCRFSLLLMIWKLCIFFFFTESCPLWIWNQENHIFDCTEGNSTKVLASTLQYFHWVHCIIHIYSYILFVWCTGCGHK